MIIACPQKKTIPIAKKPIKLQMIPDVLVKENNPLGESNARRN
jgi:hypothetical protein